MFFKREGIHSRDYVPGSLPGGNTAGAMNLDHQNLTRKAIYTMAVVTAQRETHGTGLEVGHRKLSKLKCY